ncbi:DUF4097 family beta strand repeat-containing protein [Streptomyces sp. NPDC000410]|uniref:DUF4097 family beta strand repeat-containing protein n=1 Tax=Streptomyces sp. NPDC000410 TaxID=3154254 RepID=UPI00331A3721
MPSFDTPKPITAVIDLQVGTARIVATDRTDTEVEVLPANAASDNDVRDAEQTTVTCSGGVLTVKAPRRRSPFNKPGAVDVLIGLPAGSELQGTVGVGDFHCTGRFGDTRLRSSVGDIRVEEAAGVRLRNDLGAIRLERATAAGEITAAGPVTVGRVDGTLTVKNGNGDTELDEVTGALEISAANGRIEVGTAHADVEAKSSNGPIRIDRITRGKVTLRGSVGNIEVGIPATTAAWVDVHTGVGALRNSLTDAVGPGDAIDTVELRARTTVGDIHIRRA